MEGEPRGYDLFFGAEKAEFGLFSSRIWPGDPMWSCLNGYIVLENSLKFLDFCCQRMGWFCWKARPKLKSWILERLEPWVLGPLGRKRQLGATKSTIEWSFPFRSSLPFCWCLESWPNVMPNRRFVQHSEATQQQKNIQQKKKHKTNKQKKNKQTNKTKKQTVTQNQTIIKFPPRKPSAEGACRHLWPLGSCPICCQESWAKRNWNLVWWCMKYDIFKNLIWSFWCQLWVKKCNYLQPLLFCNVFVFAISCSKNIGGTSFIA